jgi:hypothetical protein
MKVKEVFKQTLDKMLKDGEFDKLIAYTDVKTEKKEIETYKKALEQYGAEKLPIFFLIMNANAPILKDVVSIMIGADDAE